MKRINIYTLIQVKRARRYYNFNITQTEFENMHHYCRIMLSAYPDSNPYLVYDDLLTKYQDFELVDEFYKVLMYLHPELFL